MHKCVNNSVGNIYHLEQMVDNFFPYSQKQLGFDEDVEIIFQSDDENSSKMLGKTAYYDPGTYQVVLYVDGRHPKDVLRSLSHELVHHAQNCRGDFAGPQSMQAGYAQKDTHLRKMEREAYTKGNLIFRDFEDLIKTGKINIEIDFSDSGEPKMSLKEWKNNEINTKLMKKWGLLKEDSGAEERRHAEDNIRDDEKHIKNLKRDEKDDEKELEEGWGYRKEDDWGKSPAAFTGTEKEEKKAIKHVEDEEGLEEVWGLSADEKRKKLASKPDFSAGGPKEDDPGVDPPMAHALEKAQTARRPVAKSSKSGAGDRMRARRGARGGGGAGSKNVFTMGENSGKISVKEAKEITRRIIERIRKEGN